MIKTFINGSAESVEYTDTPSFNAPPSNIDIYMLASVDAISPPDAREWDFTVDIPNERISTLPNGYTIMIADTREAIESGYGYKVLFKKSEYYGIEHYRIKVNAPFYIGIGNTDEAISPGDLSIYTVETFLDSHFAFAILGESAKCILFKDDTEPCAVYVNGERQDNISYIPTSAEGADSVSYKSEYKNNLRTLQIKGNTVQKESVVQEGILPSEYQEVEYIESTGTQYIDTGFKPNQNTKVELKCQYISLASSSIFGSNPYFVLTTGDSRFRFRYNSNSLSLKDSASILAKLTLDKNKAYFNDELVGTFTEATFQSPYNALLFARGTESGGIEEKCSAKLYYAKLWDNGVLVRDYIPCYRKNDNVIGLYDLVNGVFYTNAGTGTFLKGADVSTQIGGTTNPTIANPAPITNCGNGQIEVVAKGVNLFNLTVDDFLNGSNVGSGKRVTLTLKPNTQYTLSSNAEMYGPQATNIWFNGTQTDVNGVWINHPRTTTTDSNGELYILIRTESITNIFENYWIQLVEGAEPLPYEPYFNSTVSIPANVVLESGANETLLELAKIGDIADTITIDRVNNEVKYIQRICRVRPFVNVGGTLEYDSYDSPYYNVDLWWFTLNKPATLDVGKCEFAKVDTITETETDFCVEIGNTYMIIGIPKSLSINTPEALESYLMQTGNFGLSIFYVLEEPIEWTITDNMESMGNTVNLKTMLLEWAKNTKNQTNIIEITSTPSVTKTSVNYAKWGGVPNENNT